MRVKEKNKHVKTTSNFDVLVINAIRIKKVNTNRFIISVSAFQVSFHLHAVFSFGNWLVFWFGIWYNGENEM